IVPVEWKQLFLPGQEQTKSSIGLNRLPSVLVKAIRRLGFKQSEPYYRYWNSPIRERRYILRPHSFPLSVGL
ncbi:hypothetical protein WKW50_26175, partial [Ochrobactrum sp. GPK 3]